MKPSPAARLAAAAAAALLASGCAAPPRTMLYGWDAYQPQVYEYLKSQGNDEPQAQIAALEEGAQKIQGRGAALPPGYRAHLAMLYARAGQADKSAEHLAAEKTQFPESTVFMDFLARTLSGETAP